MRSNTATAIWALLALAPSAIAWQSAGQPLSVTPQSRLWIGGSSTMRSFECKAKSFDARVDGAGADAVDAVLAGQKAVNSVQVTVQAEQLDCGNGTMNEHMLKALKAKEHPVIQFRMNSYDMSKAADAMTGTLTGTLKIGGVEKPITLEAVGRPTGEGALHVTGKYDVHMKQWELKPPSLMMGTMKVDERVTVNFDLFLKS